MEALNIKRARLRRELQKAYDCWMTASAGGRPDVPIDTSGTAEASKSEWFDYLAAKERLVRAYAETPLAA